MTYVICGNCSSYACATQMKLLHVRSCEVGLVLLLNAALPSLRALLWNESRVKCAEQDITTDSQRLLDTNALMIRCVLQHEVCPHIDKFVNESNPVIIET